MICVFQAIVNEMRGDAGDYPSAGMTYKGKDTDVVRQSVYGVSSNPPAGSNGLLLKVDGSNSTKYAILDYVTGRFRNLSEGEVQIGNYLTQASIKFDQSGNVTVNVPNGDLTANVSGSTDITTESLTISAAGGSVINANLNVNGVITANDFNSSGAGVSFNNHVHTGDSGGSTSTPI